jgi:hypothetical protein
VALGRLPPDFKCHLCPVWWHRKTCPHGDRCHKVHGIQELRWGLLCTQPCPEIRLWLCKCADQLSLYFGSLWAAAARLP